MAKSKTSNFFMWIIMGLLILGLVGFGATNFGGSVNSVARVGDTDVDVNRYARALQQEVSALSAQTGQPITLAQAAQFGIDRQVLGQVVAQATIENEALVNQISIGDERVAEEILRVPAFAGLDGSFDREAYAFTLENNGITVSEFEDQIRRETAAQLIQTAVVSGARAPSAYTQTVLGYALEERDVTWVRLQEDSLAEPIPEPSEDDLIGFHADNADRYTIGETRAITYAWVTPEMIIDSVEIDEAALRTLYDERIDDYVQPERRLVERLVFGSEADASAAVTAIENGETTFSELVAERGLTASDVDLGDVSLDGLGDAGEAVFALTEPGVVGPFQTSLGPALFQMNAVLSAREITYEDAQVDLREVLAADRARRLIEDSIFDAEDLLAGGATLEELADETDMQVGTIDWRPDVTTGIAGYNAFRAAAAAVSEADFPEVIELEDGGIFALRLDEVREPELQPLQDVRARVIRDWEVDATTNALVAEAEVIAQELRDGREMASLDFLIETERGLRRDGFVIATPDEFVPTVFGMDAGEIAVFGTPGQAMIVRLDAINEPSVTDPDVAQLDAVVTQQTTQQIARDMLAAFTTAAQAEAGVTVNQAAINAVQAQLQ
ncbi:MAG: SurA N-terminal domain-containing protein [Rhodobacteraceae bacterium]|nr:SurA N-terminal domain-containing protein [Paracoccaceae bacterium]